MQAGRQQVAHLAHGLGGLAFAGLVGVQAGVVDAQAGLLCEREHQPQVALRDAHLARGIGVQHAERAAPRRERRDHGGLRVQFGQPRAHPAALVTAALVHDGRAAHEHPLEGGRADAHAAAETLAKPVGEHLAGAGLLSLEGRIQQTDQGTLETERLRRRFSGGLKQLWQVQAASHATNKPGHGFLFAPRAAPGLAGLHALTGQPENRGQGQQTFQSRSAACPLAAHYVQKQRAEQQGVVHAVSGVAPGQRGLSAQTWITQGQPTPEFGQWGQLYGRRLCGSTLGLADDQTDPDAVRVGLVHHALCEQAGKGLDALGQRKRQQQRRPVGGHGGGHGESLSPAGCRPG